MCGTIEHLLADPEMKSLVEQLNPGFQPPSRPFTRMDYKAAIEWLNEHDIKNDEGQPHKIGDDIAEAAERKMTDALNVPIFLCGFPREIKAFYMKQDPTDPRLALCVDMLAPEGYGEIIGGGERISDLELLEKRIAEHELPIESYQWYLDIRRYGTVPHSGFGIGLERTVSWICGLNHVRETVPFPRMLTRMYP